MSRIASAALAAWLLASTPSLAATWYVSPDGTGDALTVQAGIDLASAGDVVLVAAGTYYENVVMEDGVSLESESGAALTILDGSRAGHVIDCDGLLNAAAIRGFTIRHGAAEFGGGVRCWNGSSPLVEHNVFEENSASYGGAIGCRYGSAPTVRHNDIVRNRARNEGGGLYAIDGWGARMIVTDNHIHSNRVGAGATASGGGVWLGAIDFELRDNRIERNVATYGGGGIWAGFSGRKAIVGNVVRNNECVDLGGGAWISQGFTRIEGNTFHGNSAPSGGAIGLGRGEMLFARNILSSSPRGAAVFVNNLAADATLECNDLWGNAGGDEIPPTLIDAGGNASADPQFCEPGQGDLEIRASSPCAPANSNGCGLIGALPVGCGRLHLEEESWARIKARYQVDPAPNPR